MLAPSSRLAIVSILVGVVLGIAVTAGVHAAGADAAEFKGLPDGRGTAARPAVTYFLGAGKAGGRRAEAAESLTRLHGEFAQRGYELVEAVSYVENGDLQGFFVSYRAVAQ
jgi:hypothetical protein